MTPMKPQEVDYLEKNRMEISRLTSINEVDIRNVSFPEEAFAWSVSGKIQWGPIGKRTYDSREHF